MWADVDSLLLAEIATTVSDLRWLAAVARISEEHMPDGWGDLHRYGPARTDDEPAEQASEEAAIERARQAASEILG